MTIKSVIFSFSFRHSFIFHIMMFKQVVVRLAGTNADGAKKVLEDSGLPLQG